MKCDCTTENRYDLDIEHTPRTQLNYKVHSRAQTVSARVAPAVLRRIEAQFLGVAIAPTWLVHLLGWVGGWIGLNPYCTILV